MLVWQTTKHWLYKGRVCEVQRTDFGGDTIYRGRVAVETGLPDNGDRLRESWNLSLDVKRHPERTGLGPAHTTGTGPTGHGTTGGRPPAAPPNHSANPNTGGQSNTSAAPSCQNPTTPNQQTWVYFYWGSADDPQLSVARSTAEDLAQDIADLEY